MHVRVCPDCSQEYRPEIARCADCGAELQDRDVDAASAFEPARPADEPTPERPPGNYRAISWAGHAAELVPLADRLVELGIPLAIRPREVESGDPGKGFELLVRDEEREAALAAMASQEQAAGAAAPNTGDYDPAVGYRRCPACSTELRPGTAECPECGLAVAEGPEGHTCPQCGAALDPAEAACPSCGLGTP
jgi:Double zinc ribbon